jgi:hypothetical protein
VGPPNQQLVGDRLKEALPMVVVVVVASAIRLQPNPENESSSAFPYQRAPITRPRRGAINPVSPVQTAPSFSP